MAHAVLTRYHDEKERAGFSISTISSTSALTCSRDLDAAFVLYKLDRGIEHLLVDEAQDTSPKHWAIVRA